MDPEPSYRHPSSNRLGDRFPGVYHPSLVNKDFTDLTSDRRAHRPQRTFFLGEIFAATPETKAQRLHGALLVTRRTRHPADPVEIAPSLPPGCAPPPGTWMPPPDAWPEDLRPGTAFALLYRRPVPRTAPGRHLATLPALAKQDLAKALTYLTKPA